jgi:tetratricopeptide (TPR) repeat protein
MTAAFFGLRTLRALPTLLRLFAALRSGAVKWPGPRVHNPDPNASIVRERLGVGYQNLFSTFTWHIVVVMAAFAFSILSFVGFSQSLVVPREGRAWEVLILIFIVYIGGVIGSKRADHNRAQVNILLSDLAGGVEPRQIDGRFAEAEYAIEHPLIGHQTPWSDSTRALNLFYESVTYHRAGNQYKALNLHQEALTIDPSLHKRALEILSKMAQECSPTDAGPICYWLGVHSEYLVDLKQAAVWYEKAANAFGQIGYEKRQGRALCNLGNVKYRLRDSSAMDEFEKAIALNPRDGTAHFNIAMIYYRISYSGDARYERALDEFAEAIIAEPETYSPVMIASRMRSIDDTWKEDMKDVMQRVSNRKH